MPRKKRNKQYKDRSKAPVKDTNTPSKKSDKMDEDEENPKERTGNERRMVKVRRYFTYLWPPYLLDLVFCSLFRLQLFTYKKIAGKMPLFLEGHVDSVRSKEQNAIEVRTKRNEELLSEISNSSTIWTEKNQRKDGIIDELENENKRLQTENQDLLRKNEQQLEECKNKDGTIQQLKNENKHLQTETQDLLRKNEQQVEEYKNKDGTIQQLKNENKRLQTETQDLLRKNEQQLEECKNKDGTIQQLKNENKRLQTENHDLARRNDKHLEEIGRKDSRIEQLQTDNMHLQAENNQHKSEIENKAEVISSLGRRQNEKETEIARLRDKINEVEKQCKALKEEKQDALRRLSELVSVKLRDNNPNIADLNDEFRPTKLVEMFSELYDNEWTSAYEMLENNSFSEKQAIIVLLDTVMIAYGFCEELVEQSWHDLEDWFLNEDIPDFQKTTKWLKDSRKSKVKNKVKDIIQDFCTIMTNMCNKTKLKDLLTDDLMTTYFTNCIELCLLMVATDPPVVLGCPGWKPIQITKIKENNPIKQNTAEELPEEKKCQQLEAMPTEECPGQHGEHQQLQVKTNEESAEGSTSNKEQQQVEQVEAMPKQESVDDVTSLNEECKKPEEMKNLESFDNVTAPNGSCQQIEEMTNLVSIDRVTSSNGSCQQVEEMTHTVGIDGVTSSNGSCEQVEEMTNPVGIDVVTASNGSCEQVEEKSNAESINDTTVSENDRQPLVEMMIPEIAYEITAHDVRPELDEMNNTESAYDVAASNKEYQKEEVSEECQKREEMTKAESAHDKTAPQDCQQLDLKSKDGTHDRPKTDNVVGKEETKFEKAREKENFDKATFKEYTKRGKFLDFVVWPAVYLHKGGPLLGKGIAQGTKEQHTPPDAEVWTWR